MLKWKNIAKILSTCCQERLQCVILNHVKIRSQPILTVIFTDDITQFGVRHIGILSYDHLFNG